MFIVQHSTGAVGRGRPRGKWAGGGHGARGPGARVCRVDALMVRDACVLHVNVSIRMLSTEHARSMDAVSHPPPSPAPAHLYELTGNAFLSVWGNF